MQVSMCRPPAFEGACGKPRLAFHGQCVSRFGRCESVDRVSFGRTVCSKMATILLRWFLAIPFWPVERTCQSWCRLSPLYSTSVEPRCRNMGNRQDGTSMALQIPIEGVSFKRQRVKTVLRDVCGLITPVLMFYPTSCGQSGATAICWKAKSPAECMSSAVFLPLFMYSENLVWHGRTFVSSSPKKFGPLNHTQGAERAPMKGGQLFKYAAPHLLFD